MVSFLKYLVFFQAGFCAEQVLITCRIDFDMFFAFLTFDPVDDFAKAIGFA